MQSQQKRLKWSRGETAEALEERTDTGITQASVELMENCIPDIYGNISRRPALKLLSGSYAFAGDEYMQVIPFYITETDYILVGIHYARTPEFIRVTDGVMVSYNSASMASYPSTRETEGGTYQYKPVSYAQQNNYMIIADAKNLWKISFTFGTGSTFTPVIEVCKFTAEWYAPNGTQTKTETASTIPGLLISGDVRNYTVTTADNSTVFSSLPTGLNRGQGSAVWRSPTTTFYFGITNGVYGINTSGGYQTTIAYWTMTNGQSYEDGEIVVENTSGLVRFDIVSESSVRFMGLTPVDNIWTLQTTYDCFADVFPFSYKDSWTAITTRIPAGSIVKMPNIGCYMRVEGYFSSPSVFFPGVVFDNIITLDTNVDLPSGYTTGAVCIARTTDSDMHLEYWQDGSYVGRAPEGMQPADTLMYIRCSTSVSDSGSVCGKFHYNDHAWHFIWGATPWSSQDIYMYGALLTPIADAAATDSAVSVEYGYVSLTPTSWSSTSSFPHPRKTVFSGQRLWAGAWQVQASGDQYSIVIGSQIGRYTDFKNDYNQENEPITLDILTQYKEKIFHLIDYNGLKIMTDSYEYAYDGTNGVVKQSANGSFEYCEPVVFDSLCLYVDSTGQQVKAMQYEFQSNIFNSSTINQVAPHDLVWYPWTMASYEDKYNSTGKYLFLVNRQDAEARVAVCNFVPSNQANIWSRWTFPVITYSVGSNSIIDSVVNLKGSVLFMVRVHNVSSSPLGSAIVPAALDFDGIADLEGSIYVSGGTNYYLIKTNQSSQRLSLANTQVAVYADGVFQWLDTTTSIGALTKSIEGLTNVTVGLPINSTIISHPIDVGGKTKSIKKRIGKARMSVHDTEADVITINGKTGYMNPAKDQISFYGVTGMKNEIKYTITNKNGGMFHLESLLMNIEYGTLDS